MNNSNKKQTDTENRIVVGQEKKGWGKNKEGQLCCDGWKLTF